MNFSDFLTALTFSVMASSAVASTDATMQERMTFKLEIIQRGTSHQTIDLYATVGKPALYSEARNLANEGYSKQLGIQVRVLPKAIELDGSVVTEVSYSVREQDKFVKRSHLVKIKHGETTPLYTSSSDGEIVRLALMN